MLGRGESRCRPGTGSERKDWKSPVDEAGHIQKERSASGCPRQVVVENARSTTPYVFVFCPGANAKANRGAMLLRSSVMDCQL